LIAALVAAIRDRFAYSRADCICDRSSCSSTVIERMRRIIREVERMRQGASHVLRRILSLSGDGDNHPWISASNGAEFSNVPPELSNVHDKLKHVGHLIKAEVQTSAAAT
jgi:hypothetical protein